MGTKHLFGPDLTTASYIGSIKRLGENCYSLAGLTTRASINTSTALAPPRNNAFVKAANVAPVAKTSSTSNT